MDNPKINLLSKNKIPGISFLRDCIDTICPLSYIFYLSSQLYCDIYGKWQRTWLLTSAQERDRRLARSFVAVISNLMVPSAASILVILPPRSRMLLPTSATSPFSKVSSLLILDRSANSSLAFRALSTSATSLCSSVTALPSHRTRNRSFFASLPLPPRRAFTSFLHVRRYIDYNMRIFLEYF